MPRITVANTTALRISLLAWNTTRSTGARSPAGRAAFSRRRRNTFSTSMMASSTSSPMATARPPSVITLIVRPSADSTRKATARLSGSAVRVMSVVRTSIRNSTSTITMKIAASRSTLTRLSTERWMKSAWRITCVLSAMPGGSAACASASLRSMASVSASVFVPGDFCTDSTTALRASSAAAPRLGAAPRRTSATWPMVTGWPSRWATTAPARSASERTRPVWRIGSSRPSTSGR